MTCAPSEISYQAGPPHSMIKAFAVRTKNPCVLGAQRANTLSDWAEAQADLSRRLAHRLVCFVTLRLIYMHHTCADRSVWGVGQECKISQNISVRPDLMHTTGTLCVRSELSYQSEQQHMGFIILSQSLNLGVRRDIIDGVATLVSYGTNLIVLVCSWISHEVAI